MKSLPQFVRRAPFVFYAIAVIVGIWRFYNDYATATASMLYAEDGGPFIMLARSTALYWGVVEAAYLLGSGVMIHVLIAIYDKIGSKAE
ncbi:MAG: hypothetical protein APF82_07155 [Sphingomonadales bacterium BRH_c42]|nr:MAG: hypothetical protein APF82_07155 [Sphingomonadales bacterium BRH_c42]